MWCLRKAIIRIILSSGLLAIGVWLNAQPPAVRQFFLDDHAIQYQKPNMEESTVNGLQLILISVGIPCMAFLVIGAISCSLKDMSASTIAFIEGFAWVKLTTTVFKNYAGALRPYFLQVCKPSSDLVCQGDEKLVWEARKSFPSGHSSYSMYGMIFLALWLIKRFGHGTHSSLASMCCFFLAVWVGLTRYSDYDHHPIDIFVGFVLGSMIAVIFYRIYCGWVEENAAKKEDNRHLTSLVGATAVDMNENTSDQPRPRLSSHATVTTYGSPLLSMENSNDEKTSVDLSIDHRTPISLKSMPLLNK